jgi:amino acid transporter
MSENNLQGVAGLKKYDVKVTSIIFMIYCLVAAGAFGIEEMISASGPGITLAMLITFPIIWAYPISNIVAECGSVLPSEGGVYVWVREAFGEFWGFQAGWWATVSTYITNGVYVALVVGYASQFIAMSSATAFGLKIGMILLFTIVNLMGIKDVGYVSSLFSILILVAFLMVTVVGLLNWNYSPVEPFIGYEMGLLEGVAGCIAICVWMYCGYECISNMAGEVKNPQVIPKGLLLAMPLIAATYVLPTLAGLASVGNWENWSTEGGFGESFGYASVLTQNLGQAWGYAFLFVAIISQCAIFNTYLASGSRGFFVLADDHLFPKFMVKVSKKRGVPHVGIISLALVTMFLAQFDFTTLVMAEVVFMLALYIILPLAVLKLRQKLPIEERVGCYVMGGGKVGLAYFVGLPIIISIFALLINGADYFLMGLLGLATGPLFYLIFKWIYGGLAVNDSVNYPLNPRTRLGLGDLTRIAWYLIISGAFSFVGSFFINWYEGEDYAYYLEEWGEGLLSNITAMIDTLMYGGLAVLVIGIALLVIGRKIDPTTTPIVVTGKDEKDLDIA